MVVGVRLYCPFHSQKNRDEAFAGPSDEAHGTLILLSACWRLLAGVSTLYREQRRVMGSILVIDDDGQVRILLRRLLEEEGHHVVEARDGRQGIQYCRQLPIDMVITDIFMDRQEGLSTILTLRREFPQIKVMAITGGTGDRDFLEAAKAFGAKWTFTKPLPLDRFLAAVRDAFT
jgi:CheY-like chemotaxis protein